MVDLLQKLARILTPRPAAVAAVGHIRAQSGLTPILAGETVASIGACISRPQEWNPSPPGEERFPIPIAGAEREASVPSPSGKLRTKTGIVTQYSTAFGVIAAVTSTAFFFTPLVGPHATALVFLLTVVLLALIVERGPTLAAAALSALLWDYFFLPPIYAFRITHFEDGMLFAMYFVVALVLGHLTARIRAQQEAEREREARTTALYLLTRDLNESCDLAEMVRRIVHQIESCFGAPSVVLLVGADNQLTPHRGSTLPIPESEQDLPAWALAHRQRAGRFTSYRSPATNLFIPLFTTSGPVGVLGLCLDPSLVTPQSDNLLDAFSRQVAMALDRHRLSRISERARVLAESERLSKTLLDSMSHEIRTPISAIQSATGNLAELGDADVNLRREMLAEIQEAIDRLNRLVGNILEAGRLESGAVRPRFTECDIKDLINVVLADVELEFRSRKLTVIVPAGLPLILMDFVLMQQALKNLLSNAALHTPDGTQIELSASVDQDALVLAVADKGPGIPSESLPRIFDKFYRVPNSKTGGTGLGLSLVKGFVEAQGGRVAVENRVGGGASFTICLPRANFPQLPFETDK